ncbi:hypothetical protein KIAC18_002658 [Sporomusa sphaeroides]|uniref:argonaute/piwi family protein n=1 Tax=Sporomusa sphaeroides TaxID=47679 RepID=UPI003DA0F095
MHTNFLEVILECDEFKVYIESYSDDRINEFREAYNDAYAFFRYRFDGEACIVAFPLSIDHNPCGFSTVKIIKATDMPLLISKIIHELLIRQIVKLGRYSAKYRPISFLSERSEDNIIADAIPEKYRSYLGYKRGYEFESRVFYPNQKPIFGVIINTFFRWDIKISCEELLKIGFDIVGKYVVCYEDSKNKLLGSRKVLLGYVESIDNQFVNIRKDTEVSTVELSKIYIENNYSNCAALLSKLLGTQNGFNLIQQIKQSSGNRKSADAQFQAIETIGSWLQKMLLGNGQFKIKFTSFVDSSNVRWRTNSLENTTFIFDLHDSKKDTVPSRGLRNFGPYDTTFFTPKTPNCAVICNRTARGTVTEFLNKLQMGLPSVTTQYGAPYGQGFVKKYGLSDLKWTIFEVDSDSFSEYEKAIKTCLASGDTWNLAIIQVNDKQRDMPNNINPYYLAKAKFMANNIPVQEIRLETMKKPDSALVYILDNIALACYAKIGGTPWVIPSNKSIDRELIIGLGSAIIKKGRFKFDRRIVGITTVFNSDGRYIMSNKSAESDFSEYLYALLDNLRGLFKEIIKEQGWNKGENIRLVFHCFKPFRFVEINAIKQLMADIGKEYNILFAFLHISSYQPLFAIEKSENGVSSYGSTNRKGKWMLPRGTGIKLDDYNYLLQITGATDIRTYNHGMARPIMMKLNRDSTFKDLDYIARQIYNFSSLSYRSFSHAPLPVTIWYSQLIAQLLGNMRDVQGWDSDVLIRNLRYSRWFL